MVSDFKNIGEFILSCAYRQRGGCFKNVCRNPVREGSCLPRMTPTPRMQLLNGGEARWFEPIR